MFDSFQSNRFVDRLHAVVQFVLVFLILAAINYIAMRHYQRSDLTLGRAYTLSAETLAYLQKLEQPIDVIVTISQSTNDPNLQEALRDIETLLHEYVYVTRDQGQNRIRVEYLEVYQQTARARELGIDEPNVIIFKSPDRQRPVLLNELYRNRDETTREFLGENVFTRSILELIDKSEPILYFTTGHGELDLNDFSSRRGASVFFDELRARNFTIKPLDLATATEIPEDASLVIIAAPQTQLSPHEEELLRSYLRRRSGRVMAMLQPQVKHGLDDLLYEWGILVDDTVIVETDPNFRITGGDIIVKRFASKHAITNDLVTRQIGILSDRARSVRADPGRPIDDSLVVTELMFTSDLSWAEKSFGRTLTPIYDEKIDLKGPVTLAAISERKVDSSLGITIPGGKLLVIGTTEFLSNNRIQASGNLFLALNSINYAIDRVTRLNIPPRPITKVKLDLSVEQLNLTRYLIWLGPPAIVGLFGVLMYLSRRN
ncbi:MAG: GldG family protein [Verrucomicrobiota bacterium]